MPKYFNQSIECLTELNEDSVLKLLEKIGRISHDSNNLIKDNSAKNFINMLLSHNPPHWSIFEHFSISFILNTNLRVTHELVRHRIASYNQLSSRYCNFSKDKYNSELYFIYPSYFYENKDKNMIDTWVENCEIMEKNYLILLHNKIPLDIAGGILSKDVWTKIVVTMNIREWLYVLKLRTDKNRAHYQMVELMEMIKKYLFEKLPSIFNDGVLNKF